MHRPITEAAWCRGQHLVAEGTKEVHRSPQSQGVDLTAESRHTLYQGYTLVTSGVTSKVQ